MERTKEGGMSVKRLTTDDEKSIMFHLNTFYAKNGEVWVRGGGPYPDFQDVTLVQWIRSASSKHGLSFTAEDPEHLGDEMYDALQDGDETVEGILALMHEAAVQAAEMRGRLKPIEDILGDDYDLGHLRELVETARQAWASVNEQMPDGHDSIFKKLIAKEKWGAGMFERLSDDVIVAVKFADGTRRSGFAHTKDGVWMGLPSIGCPVVTHWMPLPSLPEEE